MTPPFLFTRSGGVFGQVMAEYTIGQVIANERRFYAMHDCQMSGQWVKDGFTDCCRPLSNISIGILGVGDIGRKSKDHQLVTLPAAWSCSEPIPQSCSRCREQTARDVHLGAGDNTSFESNCMSPR